ncbi:MAG: GAF domain-containing protein, partial [Chloroflexi bacterium]
MGFFSPSSPTMVSASLTYLETTPRRALVLFMMRWYAVIFGCMVTLIMAIGAWHYAPAFAVLWVILYWIYYVLRIRMQEQAIFGLSYKSIWFHFWRALLVLGGITSFVGYLYLQTDYLVEHHTDPVLWLLFVLPVFIISQRSNLKLLLVTIAITAFVLGALTFVAIPNHTAEFWRDTGIKLLWLVLLPIMLHVLIQFVSDWYTITRILYDIEQKIVQFRSISEEPRLWETVVELVSEAFNYPYVNIFFLQPDGKLRCVAGSGTNGKSLAQKKYPVQSGQGIVGHVLETQTMYMSNYVKRDPHYVAHPDFPKTQAELAVPIKLDGQILGILDIQACQSGIFLHQDREVMDVMSGYLGVVLDNLRLMRSRQRVDKIVASIARRFLSQSELTYTLDEIAEAACEELFADVVVLYEYNPLINKIVGPSHAGKLNDEALFGASAFEPDSIVQRLLLVADRDYFQETVHEIAGERTTADNIDSGTISGAATFVEREKIKSRAILRLRADNDCVGLM